MKLKAYAKINLTLDITGKRADGYHTIESIMQSVSMFDLISIAKSSVEEVAVTCNKGWFPVKDNTAVKMAEAFYQHTGIDRGIRIDIEKNIPTRAGLGGGSADAAAVLKGMDALYETKLSEEEMLGIAKKVGADVPFCVVGGTCKCTGIGDEIFKISPIPDCSILICKPSVGMSTPRAYALVDKFPEQKNLATPRMESALFSKDIHRAAHAVSNRFEEVLKLESVKKLRKAMMVEGAINAMMTGSGSAVYGIFDDVERAEKCKQCLKGNVEKFVVSPVSNGVEFL